MEQRMNEEVVFCTEENKEIIFERSKSEQNASEQFNKR